VVTGAAPRPHRPEEGRPGVIQICKTVLSGAGPVLIAEQAARLAPAPLRELAAQLAADSDLTVSVITYDDGRAELEVLHTGPPRHAADAIDTRFARDPDAPPARTVPAATPAADAAAMIRAVLRAAHHATG
jgi:hypothetical protein